MNSVKKASPNDLVIFKTITDFVSSLKTCYGDKKNTNTHALNLYNRLITNVKLQDDALMERHIQIFRDFCRANAQCIEESNTEFKQSKIEFTEKIYINMDYFCKQAQTPDLSIIFEYLLTISAHVDPDSKAKDILKKLKESDPSNLISNVFETINKEIEGKNIENPMEFIGDFVKSDSFHTIVDDISNVITSDKMDLPTLLNTFQNILGNDIDLSQLANLIPSGGNGQGMDMAKMMSMFMGGNMDLSKMDPEALRALLPSPQVKTAPPPAADLDVD